ncbi:MAG: hypothetical protein WC511_00755 [Candidatus Pacearchaeota archaeon]
MEYEQRYSEKQAKQIIDFALREQSKCPEGDLVQILSDFKVDETIQKEALRKFRKKIKNKPSLERKLSFNKKELLLLPLSAFAGANVSGIITGVYGGIYSLIANQPFIPIFKSGIKYGALFGVAGFLVGESIKLYNQRIEDNSKLL